MQTTHYKLWKSTQTGNRN